MSLSVTEVDNHFWWSLVLVFDIHCCHFKPSMSHPSTSEFYLYDFNCCRCYCRYISKWNVNIICRTWCQAYRMSWQVRFDCVLNLHAVVQVFCNGFLFRENADCLRSLSVTRCNAAKHGVSNLCFGHSAAARLVWSHAISRFHVAVTLWWCGLVAAFRSMKLLYIVPS